MNAKELNRAVVLSIQASAVPGIDRTRLVEAYGEAQAAAVAETIIGLIQEATSMQVEWTGVTLAEGVSDALTSLQQRHPGLSAAALNEIGRCVGWQLR